MTSKPEANSGSFRDPVNRVYEIDTKSGKRILRGLSADALKIYQSLAETEFYQKLTTSGKVVETKLLPPSDKDAKAVVKDGWAGVLEHETIPFVSSL